MNLTADNLQNTLWKTIQGVKSNKTKVDVANAIATTAREIIKTEKLKLEYLKLTGNKVVSGFMNSEKKVIPKTVTKTIVKKRGRPVGSKNK